MVEDRFCCVVNVGVDAEVWLTNAVRCIRETCVRRVTYVVREPCVGVVATFQRDTTVCNEAWVTDGAVAVIVFDTVNCAGGKQLCQRFQGPSTTRIEHN